MISFEQFKQAEESSLRAEDGWLCLIGLAWLHEGDNTVGADAKSDVKLPEQLAPQQACVLTLTSNASVFVKSVASPDALKLKSSGETPHPTVALNLDSDVLLVGRLQLLVIKRGQRIGVRVRDPQHPARTRATLYRRWFPYNESLCFSQAPFTPYESPHVVKIQNVLGDTLQQSFIGYVSFAVHGVAYRLDASGSLSGGLNLHFRDRTAGKQTYGAGRMLSAPAPKSSSNDLKELFTVLDFNRAYCPPCAFTEFATCPLPPQQNQLPVEILAGELVPDIDGHSQ